ncbi:DNA polymerase III subunit gamma/tau [Neptunomonas phycophila]|uniref:DNA polymerase III subunit gamma/tau n=1 Tax=Neptunomonas phycophila TaxID=1572645 RepID=UPI001BE6F449|nr:DNA polymerase III subunit gamma/tau [Neptunomonas phycophila]MBT3146779.1 DNA polymerase III subunit gamma/tau [Neptunomonas phycophila]
MSYQVLARKWRPKRFTEMVGQEHVLKALVNALDEDRLHHAYLFTGTRGVGKTSIARLFAKSLNCETGVSSEPCGVCSACREIAEGRFVDLIEVDAASRTKVEDTRELLENVQYAPTHGRFKVYLIDEVHMLSSHSFNALLKTLEEPPPHVKFLLATTDPQKLPVTILSRCLQFNLKNLIPERIVHHLQFVLGEEQIAFEDPALWLLARSADGSMRDALSLTDQAIAFGAGSVNENDVRAMLGTIDQRLVYRMLDALVAHDAKLLLSSVAELSRFSPDYMTVLGDMISLLHRVAVAQTLPEAVDNSMGDQQQVTTLAGQLTAEDVQLFYQIALMGRKDLPYVPDAREGLEMVLLRMLAFRPADTAARPVTLNPSSDRKPTESQGAPAGLAPVIDQPVPVEPQAESAPIAAQSVEPMPASETSNSRTEDTPPWEEQPLDKPQEASQPSVTAAPSRINEPVEPSAPSASDLAPPFYDESDIPAQEADENYASKKPSNASEQPSQNVSPAEHKAPVVAASQQPSVAVPQRQPMMDAAANAIETPDSSAEAHIVKTADMPPATLDKKIAFNEFSLDLWVSVVSQLGLTGMTASLANTLSLEEVSSAELVYHYTADQEALLSGVHKERIQDAILDYFNASIEVKFVKNAQTRETPSQYFSRIKAERLEEAIVSFEQDLVVQTLVEEFQGVVIRDSIVPIDTNGL